MDRLRFQLTAQWVAELMQDPKFDKQAFSKYVQRLITQAKEAQKVMQYPKEIEDQNEDLIKNLF